MSTILFTNDIPFNPFYGGIERATDVLVKSLLAKGYKIFYLSSRCSNQDILDYHFPVTQYLLPNKNLFSEENKAFYFDFLIKNSIQIVVNQRGLLPEGNFYIDNLPLNIKSVSCFHSKPFGYWEISKDIIFLNHKSTIGLLKCFLKLVTYPLSLYLLKKFEYQKTKKQLEFAVNKSNYAVFLSEDYINTVLNRCQIVNSNITSIPNPNTYTTSEIIQIPKEKIILFVGRLTYWDKRPKTILQIWSKIQKEFSDWSLYIVGHGELMNNLKAFISKNRLERVYLEGKQNPLHYYQRASILCMTSAYEGFPMVLTESMQNSVIPITFGSFGSSYDIIDNEKDGYVIPPFDIDKYAETLSKLMNNEVQRLLMGRNACKSTARFDTEIIISKWEQLFNNILKQ